MEPALARHALGCLLDHAIGARVAVADRVAKQAAGRVQQGEARARAVPVDEEDPGAHERGAEEQEGQSHGVGREKIPRPRQGQTKAARRCRHGVKVFRNFSRHAGYWRATPRLYAE